MNEYKLQLNNEQINFLFKFFLRHEFKNEMTVEIFEQSYGMEIVFKTIDFDFQTITLLKQVLKPE